MENEIRKNRMHDFSTKIYLIIVCMLNSSSINLCASYFLKTGEKLVALLVYSSFVQVVTSGFRIIPYPLVVVVVCVQLKSVSGNTPYPTQVCSTA